ncbi:MAG: YidB family protein [Polaromonas sp.]|nr:YidB family protein [Polaromonas sp.]
MGNDFGQILGSLFGQARSGGHSASGMPPGGLGDLLGGMLGGGQRTPGGLGGLGGLGARGGSSSGLGGGKGGALVAMLLPFAMQWVQRNGGLSGVLGRVQQKGYSQQAASWVSTGPNQDLPPEAVGEIVGTEELSRLSKQLDVDESVVSSSMAQILPEVVNQLTPDGNVPDDSDDVLGQGLRSLELFLNSSEAR